SLKDGKHYTSIGRDGNGQFLVKYAYETGLAVDTIFSTNDIDRENFRFSDYTYNPDETKLLLATERESIYRRSSKSHYFAYDLNEKKLVPITGFSKGKQQLAAFSPTANQVAFVRDNDLYISDLDENTEEQLTTDGKWGEIINGAIDWVYEEEFSFHRGFYWSPDGSKIGYYKFDESDVPEFNITYYNDLYPENYNFKYPKAGEKNSEVRVMVYDLASNSHAEVDVNSEADQYIPRIKWTKNSDLLCVMRMNRLQNKLEFLLANTKNASEDEISVETVYTETAETYIEINDNLIFLDDEKHFVWNSEKDGWNHIYLFDMDGSEVARLTGGDWEVIEFYGVDQENMRVFFSAAIGSPIEKEIYSLDFEKAIQKFKKTGKTVQPSELPKPKNLTPNGHTNSAAFSNTFSYFINFESAANQPNHITLRDARGKTVRDLKDNSELKKKVEKLDINPKEFGAFKTEAGHELNYWMIKPPVFDPEKEYPVMFMIYGGPGSNTVSNSWGGSNYFWHQMLAQSGFVIISVDPRGTMRRGRDFKHSTYRQLGKLETEDLIYSAKHFGNLDYIDADRLGIMGWSYGGYMSSLALTKGADYFKLGIAVAPVTNWRFYDTIYTERFMRTPQENASGYDDNSPINHVDKLKGHYLLVHGAADDNVHHQNTMEMINALVEADKQFDLFLYPDRNHGIYGGNTRYHLYTKMTNFIKENL
ncbi:MAG: S9 family peptidase, partial [Flavobacteriales bacterium]|nr:S9 family peptidase [Flavobacteriales bacterium]